jgi:hypothetical protein
MALGPEVGSNFQPFVHKRHAKHYDDEDFTRGHGRAKWNGSSIAGRSMDRGIEVTARFEMETALHRASTVPNAKVSRRACTTQYASRRRADGRGRKKLNESRIPGTRRVAGICGGAI